MLQHVTWLYLWIAPHVLVLCVAALMLRRNLHKEYPIFFSYLVFEFLQFCVLFGLHEVFTAGTSSRLLISIYQMTDMFGRAGSIALRFGILHELFEMPLRDNAELRRSMTRALNRMTAVLVVLAGVFIALAFYHDFRSWFFPPYLISLSLNVAQCGLLVLVFVWHRYLGVVMAPPSFGISVGMGLIACFEPLAHALKNILAEQRTVLPDFLQMMVYHLVVLGWLYFVLVREKARSTSTPAVLDLRGQIAEVGRIVRL